MVSLDIGAISVAMYEDFYDDIPKMNISVYGVPKTLFKKKFGKTFGPKEFFLSVSLYFKNSFGPNVFPNFFLNKFFGTPYTDILILGLSS